MGTGYPQGQAGFWGARLCWEQGKGLGTHRVGLLCASGRVSLGVLVSLDQQLDQAGDDGGLLQWGVVGRTQGQVADQAYGSLEEGRRKEPFVSTVDQSSTCSPRDPLAAPIRPTPSPSWCRLTPLLPALDPSSPQAELQFQQAAGMSHFPSSAAVKDMTQQQQGCGSSSHHHCAQHQTPSAAHPTTEQQAGARSSPSTALLLPTTPLWPLTLTSGHWLGWLRSLTMAGMP